MPISRPLEERLWEKVRKTATCWLWEGATMPNGYGRIGIYHGTGMLVHRAAYGLARGKIPRGKQVLHHCDVRNCVRPDHLFIGTPADNGADMAVKGRSTIGEKNPRAKLTEKKVAKIKRALLNGVTPAILGPRFNVSPAAIYLIAKNERWKKVEARNG